MSAQNNIHNEMIEVAAVQLAQDLGCQPRDFFKRENTIVISRLSQGRRNLMTERDFFRMATFGNGVVISAASEMYCFATALMEQYKNPIEVFDAKGIYVINSELQKYGKAMGQFHQYYLPISPYIYADDEETDLKVYEGEKIQQLYGNANFQNALLYRTEGVRKDVLGVGAYLGDTLVGVAGASDDSERFWQIGIDVLPEYRNKGIATLLVSRITKEILRHGAIPYYGTWWSNIASMKVAYRCNYYPAWSETYAVNVK